MEFMRVLVGAPHQTGGLNDGYQFTVATGAAILSGVTSHGSALHASVSGNTLTALDTSNHTVFTLALNETSGVWTFTQSEPLDHLPTVQGEADTQVLDLSGLVKAVDFDGDSLALGSGQLTVTRSEERRVGKECRSAGGTDDENNKQWERDKQSTHGGNATR